MPKNDSNNQNKPERPWWVGAIISFIAIGCGLYATQIIDGCSSLF